MDVEYELQKARETVQYQEGVIAKLHKEIKGYDHKIKSLDDEVIKYVNENRALKNAIIAHFLDIELGD